MWISKAYAQSADAASQVAAAPTQTEAFLWNIGLILILVALFYLLLIKPQQRRFKEHSEMLNALKKGDSIVTGGGLIGKVEKIINDEEVLIDLGNGTKVTALRSMIQGKTESKPAAPANDRAQEDKKPAKKKAAPKTSKKDTK